MHKIDIEIHILLIVGREPVFPTNNTPSRMIPSEKKEALLASIHDSDLRDDGVICVVGNLQSKITFG